MGQWLSLPCTSASESLESLKQQLSDMLEINAEVETFTQEEIASLEKEIAERSGASRLFL